MLFLQFLDKFEGHFVTQGIYDSRDVFKSIYLAWSLLRQFPKQLLKRSPEKTLNQYYLRQPAAASAAGVGTGAN